MSYRNTLRYGPLDEVAAMVDADRMDTDQLRTVILNLIDHIERLERDTADLAKGVANVTMKAKARKS